MAPTVPARCRRFVRGHDGNYYGTVVEGGAFGAGSVFKFTPAAVLTNLVSLSFFAGTPLEALTVGSIPLAQLPVKLTSIER